MFFRQLFILFKLYQCLNLPKFNKVDECISDIALIFKINTEVEEIVGAAMRRVNAIDQHLLLKERQPLVSLEIVFVLFTHRTRAHFTCVY
jgi:hypothetical protein